MSVPGDLFRELRQSVRALRREPAFSVGAVLVLALALGANAAVLTVVDTILLRPLSYQEPERLYVVQEIIPQFSHLYPTLPVNARHFLEWQRSVGAFEDIALVDLLEQNLTGDGEPERLQVSRVTPNFFDLLGVSARTGRVFRPDDDDERTVVLSDSLWRRRFGADPELIGKTVTLGGTAHTVLGILSPDYRHHFVPSIGHSKESARVDLYRPWLLREDELPGLGNHNYVAVARLEPGVSAEGEASAELNALQADIARRFRGGTDLDLLAELVPLQEHVVTRGRSGLLLLLGAVGAVLLIASVNLSHSMLVRAVSRRREIAIRAALGASRLRVLRVIFSESLVLSAAGAALGMGLALVLLRLFAIAAPVDLPRADEVGLDFRVFGFGLALAVLTAAGLSLLPAWDLRRRDLHGSLRNTGHSLGGATLGLGGVLVGVEIASTAMLLAVTGLLVTSFVRLGEVDPGFDVSRVLTADVSLPPSDYPEAGERRRFYDGLVERLKARPGVAAVGIVSVLPLRGQAQWVDAAAAEGDTRPLSVTPLMGYRVISPDYFAAMAIPLRAGRSIENGDHPRRVAVLSAGAAESLWPGEDAVGKRFGRSDPDEGLFEVVGVVGDVRSASLHQEPEPLVYVALWERAPETASVVIRAAPSVSSLATVSWLRDAVRELDPRLPLSRVQTMSDIRSESISDRRFQTVLVSVFAASALLLAALGTYSCLAYTVARRGGEIGLRMALGANPRDVVAMVLRQGLLPVIVGLAAGLGAALLVSRALSSLLFAVSPTDAGTFGAVAAITLAVTSFACWHPARGAARIAPVRALRGEDRALR